METNWAGNVIYHTQKIHKPATLDELKSLVSRSSKVRVIGARHSFNEITDTTGTLISLEHLNKVLELNEAAKTVTVEAGITYEQLAPYLHQRGYALHNLPSCTHFTVVGACTTATHGSGLRNQSLPSVIREVVFVNHTGILVVIGKDHPHFPAVAVSLGAFGVIYRVSLQVVPTFYLSQRIYLDLPFALLKEHFKEVMARGYSVSVVPLLKQSKVDQIWIRKLAQPGQSPEDIWPKDLFGAKLNSVQLDPFDPEADQCTNNLGVISPWYEILPLYRPGTIVPLNAQNELQSEYFIPIEYAAEAVDRLDRIRHLISPYLWAMELRTIAADNMWMSPFYGRDCVALHTSWKYDYENVIKCMKLIEDQIRGWNPRPHWGKLFTFDAAHLQAVYPKLSEWRQLVETYDPAGKFRNEFLTSLLFNKTKSAL